MRVIICGAGIAGLALAGRLLATGAEPIVVEQAPGPRTQGYMIDFFGPGFDAATRTGLEPRVRELGYKVKEFGYVDKSGKVKARIDYPRFTASVSGGLVSIMRPDIELLLREPVQEKIDIRYGQTITGIDNRADGVSVTLSDGTAVDADLLVGADGIHSQTRTTVFGPESDYLRHLGFHTAAYVFEDPEIHGLVKDGFYMTDTMDRQMGFYGLRGGRVATFLVHRSDDQALPADPQATIREVYADVGWIAEKALAQCPSSENIYYDLVAQIEMPHWIDKRVTLLGDANYAVSLLAGQGASLGVAGAYVLARQLETHTDIDAALAEYQRRWHPVVTDRQAIGRRGAGWFVPHTSGQLLARRVALKAMRLPYLDRWLGNALIGKSHDNIEQTATDD
ncbi:MAG: FAD-dependent monooxygenase [Stackebrandtia sp.]